MAYADPYYNQPYTSGAPYVGPYYTGQQQLQYRAPYNQPLRQATIRTFLTGDETQTTAFSKPVHQRIDSDAISLKSKDSDRKWTRGGGCSCIFRFLGCGILTFIYLVLCVLLTLALFIRPPALSVGQLALDASSSNPIYPTDNGITVNLAMNISVTNPNFFSASFKRIEADIIYLVDSTSTQIGQGAVNNIVFESHSSENFTFPLSITYSSAIDPHDQIAIDILEKCGVIGSGQAGDINVQGKLTLGLRILVVTISPSFTKSFSFPCPAAFAQLLNSTINNISL